jgi:hypothetical protein
MIGQILKINWEKGFGFLICNSQNYYFKIRNCIDKVNVGEKVAFEKNETNIGLVAIAIRKVYENEIGTLFIPRINYHHIHLKLEDFLPDIIDRIKIDPSEEIIEFEYEFPSVIGKTYCIKTNLENKIIYAIRKGRMGHTRFATDEVPQDCKHLFLVLKKIEEGYLILTIFIGKKAAREPWDEQANLEDLEFWQNNALIFNPNDIISGSESAECPWVLNQPSICKL